MPRAALSVDSARCFCDDVDRVAFVGRDGQQPRVACDPEERDARDFCLGAAGLRERACVESSRFSEFERGAGR